MQRLFRLDFILLFLLIEAYIWKIRHIWRGFWVIIAGFMLISFIRQVAAYRNPLSSEKKFREFCAVFFHMSGLWPEKFAGADKRMHWWMTLLGMIAVNCAALGMAGALYAVLQNVPISFQGTRLWHAHYRYLAWALAQQLIANGYFFTKLLGVLKKPSLAACATGLLFAAAHLPNTGLVIITLGNGIASAWLFSRHRNTWALAAAHGLIGTLTMLLLPDAWIHGMRVGY